MKYKIYAALQEDINEGNCWINNTDLPPRSVIRIINKLTNKKVFCEIYRMDDNFVKHYNKPPRFTIDNTQNNIVLSEWYRVKLGGLTTQSEYDLDIKHCKFIGKFRASIQHPQIVVRLNTWLATIGLILGLIGIGIGIWSICLSLKPSNNSQQISSSNKLNKSFW